ncbi:MAG TPA: alkaline phosphatase family protein, partial [Allocoleopsis sp.]
MGLLMKLKPIALGVASLIAVLLVAKSTALTQILVPNSYSLHKIRHIIIIMQENRSFDSYFGTFPGADGIPMHNGVPTVCVPDPKAGNCVRPYHDSHDRNTGGSHLAEDAIADINGGKMDGFIAVAEKATQRQCQNSRASGCNSTDRTNRTTDVMGYHDDRELPNYWAYAKNFVLQDRMFEPIASWSLPAHLYMVSEWSASCSQ